MTVKTHLEDGKFQEERTYRRSADPGSSRGLGPSTYVTKHKSG